MSRSFNPQPILKYENVLDILQLIRSEQVGPVTFCNLVSFYGSPKKALEALPELARRGGRKKPLVAAKRADIEKEYEAVLAYGGKWLRYGEEGYPLLLTGISDAPPLITVLGNPALTATDKAVAVVGARNASANGCAFAKKMSRQLGEAGYVVVSGLARGIDTAAHGGALESGTVAVIAGGLDHIYPPENADLYHRIAQQGCIIAESPFGSAPMARHFPARNRIIAGMSQGTVVMEASKRSGSLITANMALDYGRDVFAVPGSPLDPRSAGANSLIKQGAILTESVADVTDNLRRPDVPMLHEPDAGGFSAAPPSVSEQVTREVQEALLRALGPEAVAAELLAEQLKAPPAVLQLAMLELELAGRIRRHFGGRISLNII